jgi:hypothetical protein
MSYEILRHRLTVLESRLELIGSLGSEVDDLLDLREQVEQLLDGCGSDRRATSLHRKVARLDEIMRAKARHILKEIDDPERLRRSRQPHPSHGWWFLDHLVEQEESRRDQERLARRAQAAVRAPAEASPGG